jgi:hypothetical protein
LASSSEEVTNVLVSSLRPYPDATIQKAPSMPGANVAAVICLKLSGDVSRDKAIGFRIYCFALRFYDSLLTRMKLVLRITIRHLVNQIS